MYLQQGDVVLEQVESIPDGSKEDTNIVQHGEATGHAHRLWGDAEIIQTPKKERYLRVVETTALRHEEHKEIKLPPGNYRIKIVREYSHFDEEARAVVD